MSNFGNIANVVDTEWETIGNWSGGERITIEIGITTVDLEENKILKTYSLPIKWVREEEISEHIVKLTGWDVKKLNKSGFELDKVISLLVSKHGFYNRLIITDCYDEFDSHAFELINRIGGLKHRLDVSVLFSLITGEPSNLGIDKMLEYFNIKFEGIPHRASVDSFNIARLFIKLQELIKTDKTYLSSIPLR